MTEKYRLQHFLHSPYFKKIFFIRVGKSFDCFGIGFRNQDLITAIRKVIFIKLVDVNIYDASHIYVYSWLDKNDNTLTRI